jgi:predicted  nucleic acid-binding Zn-ribbon protein
MTTRDAYIEKMKTQLDELNARMERLGNTAAEAQASMRASYQKDMDQLREQSAHARAKMEELKSVGEDRWDAMVTEMEKVRDAFVHSFSYFKSQV